jgi:hypothetical protein
MRIADFGLLIDEGDAVFNQVCGHGVAPKRMTGGALSFS